MTQDREAASVIEHSAKPEGYPALTDRMLHAAGNASGLTREQIERVHAEFVKYAPEHSAKEGVWPDFVAPPQYENPDPAWDDPALPDFRLIWATAKEAGYAVGLHGSMKRDCDLIAAPWTDDATDAETLVERLCTALNASIIGGPTTKPVGRVAYSLNIDGWFKPIDVSIAPRVSEHSAKEVGDGKFAETLNFYISDSENGISQVPRQKLVEIQAMLSHLRSRIGELERNRDLFRDEVKRQAAHIASQDITLAEARADEREQCAKIAEAIGRDLTAGIGEQSYAATDIAAAIRARSFLTSTRPSDGEESGR